MAEAAVNFARRRAPPRPLYKSVFDALVFLAALVIVMLALDQAGVFTPQTGIFIAVDGDSLRRGDRSSRLHGIDAPELQQTCATKMGGDYPCGQYAKRALSDLVRGQTLSCTPRDTDRYGRIVARCSVGRLDINAEMVRLGWAIAYVKHSAAYLDEEMEARKSKRGVWQGRFEIPETWRNSHRRELQQGGMTAADAMLD